MYFGRKIMYFGRILTKFSENWTERSFPTLMGSFLAMGEALGATESSQRQPKAVEAVEQQVYYSIHLKNVLIRC